jgi:hypothetical protein
MSPISFKLDGGKMTAELSQLLKTIPRENDKGAPSTDQTIQKENIVKNIEFERVFESLNIYDIPSVRKLVIIKPILMIFSMTNKFDAKGDRIYRAGFNLAVAPIDYPPEASDLSIKPS